MQTQVSQADIIQIWKSKRYAYIYACMILMH